MVRSGQVRYPDEAVLLVVAARRGDQAALDRLLRDALPLIYNVAARSLGPADADDVVQETMIRAVAALPRLRRPDRFRSWLMAIAVRETRRRGRRLGDHRERFVPVDTDDLAVDGDTPEDDAVRRLEVSRQRQELATATRWLDSADQEMLSLWWLTQAGKLDRAELAPILGISATYARVRLQRLRTRLDAARRIVAAVEGAGEPAGCGSLRGTLASWDGTPSSVWRKRLTRHIGDCQRCGARPGLLPPERLLAAIPLAVPPPSLVAHAAGPSAATVAWSVTASGSASGLPAAGRALAGKPAVLITGTVTAGAIVAAVLLRPASPQVDAAPVRPAQSAPAAAAPSSPAAPSRPAGPVPSSGSPAAPPPGPAAGAGNGGPNWSAGQLPPVSGGRYLYVSGTGSDNANGLSRGTALRTLRRAATLTRPGDTVLVDNGEYTAPGRSNVLPIDVSGTPANPITWAAYPGARPVVRATSWQGIHVHASYINVVGFTVIGLRDRLTPAQRAAGGRGDVSDPAISSNCIAADEQKTADPPQRPHHVVIWGNTVTDCPLNGISAMFADHVTVAYNVAARNGYYSPYGGSGISFHSSWNSDGGTGYKMIIRGNVTYQNRNLVPCLCSGSARKITDGNGIIVESGENTGFRGAPMRQTPYVGRTLIENNVSYDNGARGINIFDSAHVDVVNNTLHHNAQQPAITSDLSINRAGDVRVVNNIVVATRGKLAATVSRSSQIRFGHNTIVGPADAPAGPGGLTTDPLFVNPAAADFRLASGSPARNSGTAELAPAADANRVPRTGGVDRGALSRD